MEALNTALVEAPIVPVLTIPMSADVVRLAEAFVVSGLRAIEITLRTDEGLKAIAEMKRVAPSLMVGAGTILSEQDIEKAVHAGSDFLVSPGMPAHLIHAAKESPVPFLPGVATPTEAMHLSHEGFETLKLFPAAIVGGVAMLKAMGGPLQHISFMPTGGVTPENLASYLSLPNVKCVGGTWLAKADDIASNDWQSIEDRCREALRLASI